MTDANQLDATITKFINQMREEYGTDSFAAGYFASWVRQFGEADPKVRQTIIRQLTMSMAR